MEVKKAVKEDVKRLKKIAQHAQDWAARVQTTFELTQELCTHAAKAICQGSDNLQELEDLFLQAQEAISTSTKEVAVLVTSRSSDVAREVEKKGLLSRYSKTSPYSQSDVQQKLHHAHIAVGLALFDALQVQARELDRVALKSMSLVSMSTSQGIGRVSAPLTPTAQVVHRSTEGQWSDDETELCRSTPGGEHCDIDWHGFEEDLEAMAAAVQGDSVDTVVKPSSATDKIYAGHELTILRAHTKETELERDDAIRRARKAEDALIELRRQHECLVDESKGYFTEDDVLELQRALKREQMNCSSMESDLRLARATARAAEDEAQATQFALVVAQQVAAKMATDGSIQRRWTSEPSSVLQTQNQTTNSRASLPVTGSGTRSRSSGSVVDRPPNLVPTPEIPSAAEDQVHEATEDVSSDNQGEDPVVSAAATRSDSAFMARPEDTDSPGVLPAIGLTQAVGATPMQRPVLSPHRPSDVPSGSTSLADELETNPFLIEQENSRGLNTQGAIPEEQRQERVGLHRTSSVPVSSETRDTRGMAPTRRIQERLSVSSRTAQAWNPFEAAETKNPAAADGCSTQEINTITSDCQHSQQENGKWNPFEAVPVSPVKSALTGRHSSSPVGSRTGWNPFSPGSQESNIPDVGASHAVPAPEEDSSKQDWNPFDSSSSQAEESEKWNPFLEVDAPSASKPDDQPGWNPFAANN